MEKETEQRFWENLKRIDKDVKTIEWEDFHHELTRFCSLSSALKEATERKRNLQQKLESLIQVNSESLSRTNQLEEMRQRLEAKRLRAEKTSSSSKVTEQDAKKKKENLSTEVKYLVGGGTNLSATKSKFQDSNFQVGERDYYLLKAVMNELRKKQQNLISQVSFIYPLKIEDRPSQDQELDLFHGGSIVGTKPVSDGSGSVTVLGLPFSITPFTKMSFFTNKNEVQMSATALGYVAHTVTLIASYLTVPLRYPLRFGGSKTYIRDCAPSVEPPSSDKSPIATFPGNIMFGEFPLFLDGQDTTRAAYAVFLLNKNIEQLLNFVGKQSLGSRQLLPNLKKLIRIIQSPGFLKT